MSEVDMIKLLRLLAESWRGGVPLLYSNLELLLPIKAEGCLVPDEGFCGRSDEFPSSDFHIQMPTCSNPARKMSKLCRRNHNPLLDTTSFPDGTQRTSLENRSQSKLWSWRNRTRKNTARVSADCLEPLTDFFDLMSFLDATVPVTAPQVPGPCRPETFVWTGAQTQDGVLDEMSEEEEKSWSWSLERLLDIQAAVEGLGCRKLLTRTSDAWSEVQRCPQELGDKGCRKLVEHLISPVSSKRQTLSLSFQPVSAIR